MVEGPEESGEDERRGIQIEQSCEKSNAKTFALFPSDLTFCDYNAAGLRGSLLHR